MRTTFPRRPAAVNGCELSHPVAPPREGNSPSMGNLGCIAASKSWFAFMMNAFHIVGCVGNVRIEYSGRRHRSAALLSSGRWLLGKAGLCTRGDIHIVDRVQFRVGFLS